MSPQEFVHSLLNLRERRYRLCWIRKARQSFLNLIEFTPIFAGSGYDFVGYSDQPFQIHGHSDATVQPPISRVSILGFGVHLLFPDASLS
jgi:hypothetical protein